MGERGGTCTDGYGWYGYMSGLPPHRPIAPKGGTFGSYWAVSSGSTCNPLVGPLLLQEPELGFPLGSLWFPMPATRQLIDDSERLGRHWETKDWEPKGESTSSDKSTSYTFKVYHHPSDTLVTDKYLEDKTS